MYSKPDLNYLSISQLFVMRSVFGLAALAVLHSALAEDINLDDYPHLKGMKPPRIPTARVPRWVEVKHPQFEPYPIEEGELLDGAILDQFDNEEEFYKNWVVSTGVNSDGKKHTGNWTLEAAELLPGFKDDYALLLSASQEASAIARKLDPPINNVNKTLVVQYEVQVQKPLNCGGMYMKLLPENKEGYENFTNTSPYRIMFGPDVCGAITNKVHFIIHRFGTEHQLINTPFPPEPDFKSNLYTLIIHPNQNFEIRVNGVVRRAGSLLDDEMFEPPLQGPLTVPDPEDEVPEDWDSRRLIPDPKETEKPKNWYDTENALIYNQHARKPAKWNESKPLFVKDLSQPKPKTWNDETDGEWPGMVKLNPECENLDFSKGEGCGEWQRPLIRNPHYQKVWTQPLIPNPNYMGEYTRKQVKNENRNAETNVSDLDGTIGALGFELFTSNTMILFDNVYIGHSVIDAENIGNATWNPKYYIQTVLQNNIQDAFKEQEEVYTAEDSNLVKIYKYEFSQLLRDPKGYIEEIFRDFTLRFSYSRWEAVCAYPVSVFVFFLLVFFCTMLGVSIGSPRKEKTDIKALNDTKKEKREIKEKESKRKKEEKEESISTAKKSSATRKRI